MVVRASSGQIEPERVVVGVDGSEASNAAVRWAAAEAYLHSVTLYVVHAWEYPYSYPIDGRDDSRGRDVTRVDAACVLHGCLGLARDMCAGDVVGELVESGPASGVLNMVMAGDLLVLGSRGRGALKAGLFGSTVNSVLDHATVPVVVVPHATNR